MKPVLVERRVRPPSYVAYYRWRCARIKEDAHRFRFVPWFALIQNARPLKFLAVTRNIDGAMYYEPQNKQGYLVPCAWMRKAMTNDEYLKRLDAL